MEGTKSSVCESPGGDNKAGALPEALTASLNPLPIEPIVGRVDELSKLDLRLSRVAAASANEIVGHALVGPDGVGKTRIVVEYVRTRGKSKFPGGVFWIDAAVGGSYFDQRMYDVARTLRPGIADLQELRASGRKVFDVLARAIQGRAFEDPILIVLDGVTTSTAESLAELLNNVHIAAKRVRFLITSCSIEAVTNAGISSLKIEPLPPRDAVGLLTRAISKSVTQENLWKAVAKRVGYLPLALSLLNRAFRDQTISLTEFSQSLENTKNNWPSERKPELTSPGISETNFEEPLRFALQACYPQLSRKVQGAASILAVFAAVPIPAALLYVLGENVMDGETVTALRKSALLAPTVSETRPLCLEAIHPACANILREKSAQPAEDLLLISHRLKELFATERYCSARNWPLLNDCLPHSDQLLSRASQLHLTEDQAIAVIEVGMRGGLLRRAQNFYSELERTDRQVLQLAVARLGEYNLQTLACIDNLALTLRARGKNDEASELQKKLLQTRGYSVDGEVKGDIHAVYSLVSVNNLALTLKDQGKLQEARDLQERCLQARIEICGPEHPLTVTAMNNLASTLFGLRDFTGARLLIEKTIAIHGKTLGEEHPSTLAAMDGLVSLLVAVDELQDAIELLEKLLTAREKKLGNEHPATIATINNLALVVAIKGDLERSRHLLEEALTIQSKTQSDDHPSRLASIASLAPVLHMQGDLEAERELRAQELSIRRRSMGSDDPETITAMGNLVATLSAKGDLAEARKLQEEELAICRRVFGEESPATVGSMNNLAVILQQQSDLESASRLLEQVVEIHKKTLGDIHKDTLTSMNNLASLIKARGDVEGARWLQEQILEKRKRVLGSEHPDTLTSMNNLAATLKSRGDLERSRELQETVLRIRAKVLGSEHPDTLTSMNNLASMLKAKGKLPRARKLQEYVLSKRRKVLGPEHPDTLTSMNNLASVLKAQGQLEPALKLEREVLEIRKRVLGLEHPGTTIASWNFASTLIRLQGRSAAAQTIQENLQWLINRDREALAAPQRRIQDMLRKLLEGTPEAGP